MILHVSTPFGVEADLVVSGGTVAAAPPVFAHLVGSDVKPVIDWGLRKNWKLSTLLADGRSTAVLGIDDALSTSLRPALTNPDQE